MTECPPDPPSPFVDEWIRKLSTQIAAPRRALDIAMGRGRHAFLLADAGFRTFGVDSNHDVVLDTVRHARRRGLELHALVCRPHDARAPVAAF